ncbi:acyl-CoA dehydrogenase family protein [Nocardiopsis sp. YSL2]|uniref:acyl-CoA dehydrogenase family protein n=1 Tax=Nocardiopsis sp. YSL2 TaxID=2939492 RepID=UPI0026F45677|nr:acyl-CoA dehydrogenase family protein [Nocardiopsis sp. YSL2]
MTVPRLTPSALTAHLEHSEPFTEPVLARLDEAEEFPLAACRELDRIGVPRYYVPQALGGWLGDYTDLIRVIRAVSRRDLTVAIAHVKTFLGGATSWVAAEEAPGGRVEESARRLADRIAGGAVVSWALTEPDRGSDLRSGRTVAERTPSGYRLTGRKWPVNNATRSDLVSVLARTGTGSGTRDFTLVLVDKGTLAGGYEHLPKARTVGIRGADISGIAFDGAVVAEESTVGEPGTGFELVLKAFQLTRTICAGLSLGAADHALDVTWDFVRRRHLYGKALRGFPHVRARFGELFAARHTVEALSMAAGRAVHALPEEMSLYSAVVKALVPEIVDDVVIGCGELLGSRAFLREELRSGSFQKLERDHRIVGIFDGNRYVNRQSLIRQFPRLGMCWRNGALQERGLRAAVDPHAPLPRSGRLRMISRTGCSLLQALPHAVDELRATGVAPATLRSAQRVLDLCDRMHARFADDDTRAARIGAHLFDTARSYELCVAASAVVHAFLNRVGRGGTDTEFDELCLRASLAFVLSRLDGRLDEEARAVYGAVADALEVHLGQAAGLPSLMEEEELRR